MITIKFGVFTMSSSTKIDSPANPKRNAWVWGFTPQAEIWNGRLAMIGFVFILAIELFSGDGLLQFWNVLSHPELLP
jgi:Chlorophyll A-B binding protein